MKKMYLSAFCLIILSITFSMPAFSISSNQYCAQSDGKCLNKNGSAEIFSVKCGDKYCSYNENSCRKIQNLIKEYRTLKRYKYIPSVKKTYDRLDEIFSAFERKVEKCVAISWNPHEICLNGVDCRMRIELPLRHGGIGLFTPTVCKCNRSYPILCENEFCAKTHKSCSIFKLIKDEKAMDLKNCGNSNQKYKFQ